MVFGAANGREWRAFRLPINVGEAAIRNYLHGATDHRLWHRRSTIGYRLQRGEVVLFNIRIINQRIHHRWHEKPVADPMLLDCLETILRRESGNKDMYTGDHSNAEHRQSIGDMEHRGSMQPVDTRPETHATDHVVAVADQVGMAQHYTFGPTRGPTRIE